MATVRCLYAGRSGVFFDERGGRHKVFAAFDASASWFAQQSAMFPRLITVETWCERVARMPRSALIQHHANRQLPFDASDSDEVLRNRLTAGLREEPSSSITTTPAPSVEGVTSPEEAEAQPMSDAEALGDLVECLSDLGLKVEVVSDADTTEVEAEAPEAVDDTEAPESTEEEAAEEVSDLDMTDLNPIVRAQVETLMAAVEADSYPDVFRSIKVVRDAIMPEAGIPKPKPELFELARELGRRAEEMS